ncbi:alpha-L-fucosidase [Lysobacter tyrosinilyticus]
MAASVPAAAHDELRTAEATASRPRPTPSQLAWQREELAMFVHFTVNTFTGKEWGDGSESPAIFNPGKLDARQWARTAKRAGFGSMILTAKHHDGFCLWPTRTTEHCVRNSPWRDGKGDVVREFVEACRAEGLGVGFYLSPWDRNARSYGQGVAYNDFYLAQLEELLGNYGELAEIWFDGANGEGPNGKRQAYDWPRIHAAVRRLQPHAVIFSDSGPDVRWIGNERGEAGTTCWNTVDSARVPHAGFDAVWVSEALMQGDPRGGVWRPGEADVSIRPGWFWHAEENDKVRSSADLMELYFKSVGRNGKLLLNVPPTTEGRFHERDVQALEAFSTTRRSLFAHDLLQGARVRASGGTTPEAVLDAAAGRHWRAPTGSNAGWVEFESTTPLTFDVLRLEEAIEHGQHIANHRVDIWQDGVWRTVHWGTTIGNARLARFAPCTASRIRVVVEFAYDAPRLSRVALFRDPLAS